MRKPLHHRWPPSTLLIPSPPSAHASRQSPPAADDGGTWSSCTRGGEERPPQWFGYSGSGRLGGGWSRTMLQRAVARSRGPLVQRRGGRSAGRGAGHERWCCGPNLYRVWCFCCGAGMELDQCIGGRFRRVKVWIRCWGGRGSSRWPHRAARWGRARWHMLGGGRGQGCGRSGDNGQGRQCCSVCRGSGAWAG